MGYNKALADRVREELVDRPNVTEKKMFSGVCFMVDDKMCICVSQKEILCRVVPELFEDALGKNDTRVMMNNGRTMKGYVYVREEALRSKAEFDYLVHLCLAFNKFAKASKPKPKK